MDTVATQHTPGRAGRKRKGRTAFPPRCTGGGLLCVLAFMLAACSTATNSSVAPATQTVATNSSAAPAPPQRTVAAQATRVAAPVTVMVAASVGGSFAHDDLVVTVTITVTNHTNAPIYLAGTCTNPALLVTIRNRFGDEIYRTNDGVFCPILNLSDSSPIPAGGSLRSTEAPHLSRPGLLPGPYYLVKATVTLWHQGTLDQVTADPTIPGGTVTSDPVPITLS